MKVGDLVRILGSRMFGMVTQIEHAQGGYDPIIYVRTFFSEIDMQLRYENIEVLDANR